MAHLQCLSHILFHQKDGDALIIDSPDHVENFLNQKGRQAQRGFVKHHNSGKRHEASADGRHLLTGSGDTTARLWNLETGEEIHKLIGQEGVNYVALSPSERHVLAGNWFETVRLWELETVKEVRKFEGFHAIAFSPDGRKVLTSNRDHTARLWDASSGDELVTLRGHSSDIGSIAFSPDGRHVLTGSGDKTARL